MAEFFIDFVNSIQTLPALYIYITLTIVAYFENIFPPIPGDVLTVFGGYLVSLALIDFNLSVLVTTFGSLIGFMHVYFLGKWLGGSIMKENRLTFLPKEKIHEVNLQFKKYGYWLIVFNRFLAGTRAVIALFGGIANLNIQLTTLAALLSATIWNILMIWFGFLLGENWEDIIEYLKEYSFWATIIVIVLLGIFIFIQIYKKSSKALAK